MTHADFVHLRVHSAYSLSEGAIHLKDLIKLCTKNQMPAVAITDTGAMFGTLEFSKYACDEGVQPIIGCSLAISPVEEEGSVFDKGAMGKPKEDEGPGRFGLLAQNELGLSNLTKLTSKAFIETEPPAEPQVTFEALEEHAEGMIVMTGGPAGPLGKMLLDGQVEEAEALLLRLLKAFPGRVYMEIMRHGMKEEDLTEPTFIEWAFKHNVPLLATNDVYFAGPDMHHPHDALLCIEQGTVFANDSRRRVTEDHYFKTADEMKALFGDLPEAIQNTLVVAKRCAISSPFRDPILPRFGSEKEGESEAEIMERMAKDGLRKRLDDHVFTEDMDEAKREEVAKPYWDRLAFELGIINQMGFPGYFLIVADFIQWAKDHDIPVGPGRGSGAGSLVAYALTITDLDPLRWNLLFERFLNPERVSMPDFDIDFCQDRREEVIRYVQDRYGFESVAQIITFGKLQARAALRDVGRVLGLPFGQVDRLCKLVPNDPGKPTPLVQAIEDEPQLRDEAAADENVKELLDVAVSIEGLFRHASTHAAGVVIGDRPLDQLVPLYRDPRSDMPVTQFNMKWVEQAGLVKFDFLGLKTLTVLDRAKRYLKGSQGIEIDYPQIPLVDGPSFELLAKGNTVGVFQLESTGMQDTLRGLKPNLFEDIIAIVALYRPGPMDNIPTYINRKYGKEKPDYLHPLLEPILKETYGVIIYQEQVMQIAQVMAKYSLGGADLLRRAMGKKIAEEMEKQRAIFCDGAVENGVDRDQASHIFDLVAKFASYGFNKSHAAAYALVAYHTAYMKANYPVEFMAALMTLDLNNTDKLNIFRQELQRMKIEVLPPDVNSSDVEFCVQRNMNNELCVRYALAAVKNVGAEAMRGIIEERSKNGPFKDIFDFAERIDPKSVNKRILENLTRAGAFDSMEPDRAKVFHSIDTILQYANASAAEKNSDQVSLFGDPGSSMLDRPKLAEPAPWDTLTKLQHEFGAIGFYLSAHPLDAYGKALKQLGIISYTEVEERAQRGLDRATIAGTVISKKERRTSRGSPMCHVALSDASGSYEVTLFSEALAVCKDQLEVGNALMINASIQLMGEAVRMTGNAVVSLDEAAAGASAGLRITMGDDRTAMGQLQEVLEQAKEGRGIITLTLLIDGGKREVDVQLRKRVSLSPIIVGRLESLKGIVQIQEI